MNASTGSVSANGKATSAAPRDAVERTPEGIIHFDATTGRRQRMRQQASGQSAEIGASEPAPAPPTPPPPPQAAAEAETASPWWQRVMRDLPPEPNDSAPPPAVEPTLSASPNGQPAAAADPAPAGPASPPAAADPPAPSANGQTVHAGTANAETANEETAGAHSPETLRRFLVDFVVEQTGYPEEIVEMDADLEADLGIDSIKKAQMFGEIGEYFDLEPDESMSLDDFSSLQHVLDYLVGTMGTTADDQPPAAAPPPTLAATATPPAASPSAPAASSPAAAETPRDDAPASEEDLRSFLVNFVVEQTGYPEDIVEMDADLEADLGIDSIKKAQMFGEIGEYFGLEPDENISLDDFPNLATVLTYLEQHVRS